MRKAFVFVVLVAAAFAGGVVANGQMPKWVKAALQSLRSQAGEIDSVVIDDLARAQDGDRSVKHPVAEPMAPVPTPVDEASAPSDLKTQASASASTPPSDTPPSPPPALEPPKQEMTANPGTVAPQSLDLKQLEIKSLRAEGRDASSGSAPDVTAPRPAGQESEGPAGNIRLSKAAPDGGKPAGWADAPGSAPAAAVLPRGADPQVAKKDNATTLSARSQEVPTDNVPERKTTSPSTLDWASLRSRMRELGVSRYWVEGEPNGPARFRCVIPLAGRRAVGQQFEAEGDDDIQAADAALRRVALWRATEAH